MLKRAFIFSGIILLLLSISSSSFAAPPKLINFQGKLTYSSTGTPETGLKDLTFYIYPAGSGTSIWNETISNIPLDAAGQFSTILGRDNPLNIDFSQPLSVEVVYDFQNFSPMQTLSAVPYAFYAITAESVVGGGSQWATSGSDIYYNTGNVGIGTTEARQKLSVYGTIETYGTGGVKFQDGSIQTTAGGGGISQETDTLNSVLVRGNTSTRDATIGNLTLSYGADRTISIPMGPTATGNNLSISAAIGTTQGGHISLSGGNSMTTGGNASIYGGSGITGGKVYIYGGNGSLSNGDVILAHTGSAARGNVGIGTAEARQKLSVYGTIETYGTGGVKFPDGSTQTSAAAPGNFVAKTGDAMTGPLTTEGLTINQNILLSSNADKTISIPTMAGNGKNLSINAGGGTNNGGNINLSGGISTITGGNVYIYGGSGQPSLNGNVILAHTGSVAQGKVGIGTTSPGATLEVAGQVKITGGVPGSGKVLTSDSAGLASWQASPSVITGTAGQTLRNNGANWVANSVIYNDGTNVGIGTASPTTTLEVAGSFKAIGAPTTSSYGGQIVINNGAQNVGGNVQLTGGAGFGDGGNVFISGGDGSMNLDGNVILAQTLGKVGIGTASPGATLEVAGQVKITGGAPGAGKVLTSDGAGLATWQTSGIPSGTAGQTLRNNGANWVANSVIYNDGTKVGIGTVNPSQTLEVSGNIALSSGEGRTILIPQVASGNGNYLSIQAGSSAFVGNGGNLNLYGGDSAANYAGNVNIYGGNGTSSGAGGGVSIYGHDGMSGGPILISAGYANGVTAGNVTISAGSHGAGAGGNVTIYGGSGTTTNGNIILAHTGSAARGKVGIGTAEPTATLDVRGSASFEGLSSKAAVNVSAGGLIVKGGTGLYDGLVSWGSTTCNNGLTINNLSATAGTPLVIVGGVVYTQSSSRRYKTGIESVTFDTDKLFKLRPVKFRWISNGKEDIGLIAEEVEDILPELVIKNKDNQPESVRYDLLGVLLLDAVKKQQATISELQTKVDGQQKDIEALKEDIKLLKGQGQTK